MFYSLDMMTDEDKEATIKNGRGMFSAVPFESKCNEVNVQGRERRAEFFKVWWVSPWEQYVCVRPWGSGCWGWGALAEQQ